MRLNSFVRENAEAIVKNEKARAHHGNRDSLSNKGISFGFRGVKGTLGGVCSTCKIF